MWSSHTMESHSGMRGNEVLTQAIARNGPEKAVSRKRQGRANPQIQEVD